MLTKSANIMLKKGALAVVGTVICMAFAGCVLPAPVKVTDGSARNIKIEPKAQEALMLADLVVGESKVIGRVSGYTEHRRYLEMEAVQTAILAADADVLVAPMFFYETRDIGITVIVAGYPARYKNFRPNPVAESSSGAFSVGQIGGHSVIGYDRSTHSIRVANENMILIRGVPESRNDTEGRNQAPARGQQAVPVQQPSPNADAGNNQNNSEGAE